MKNNAEWLQNYSSPVGTITVLEAPRLKTAGLRYPYEKQVSVPIKVLKDAFKKIANTDKLQCYLVDFKRISKGYRLDIFLLGYDPYCGLSLGVTKAEWEQIVADVYGVITQYIGNDKWMYVEDWSTKSKFQARYSIYLQTD